MCPSILYALDLSAHIETWKQGIHLKLYLSSVCHKVSEDLWQGGRAVISSLVMVLLGELFAHIHLCKLATHHLD